MCSPPAPKGLESVSLVWFPFMYIFWHVVFSPSLAICHVDRHLQLTLYCRSPCMPPASEYLLKADPRCLFQFNDTWTCLIPFHVILQVHYIDDHISCSTFHKFSISCPQFFQSPSDRYDPHSLKQKCTKTKPPTSCLFFAFSMALSTSFLQNQPFYAYLFKTHHFPSWVMALKQSSLAASTLRESNNTQVLPLSLPFQWNSDLFSFCAQT